MKVGIISDIHGNKYALDSVLRFARKLGIEYFLVLGDLIGYYQYPGNIVRRIMLLPGEVIQGNHERILKAIFDKEESIDEITEKYGYGHADAMNQLSQQQLEWLFKLPFEKDLKIDGLKIKLCHGSPLGRDMYMYPDCDFNILKQCCNEEYDFIFIGHSHYPFIFSQNNCTLINVGSVGQSRDIGGIATWGVLDTENKIYIPQRTPYDVNMLITDLNVSKYKNNNYLSSILKRNRI